jgi:hypothetical protein
LQRPWRRRPAGIWRDGRRAAVRDESVLGPGFFIVWNGCAASVQADPGDFEEPEIFRKGDGGEVFSQPLPERAAQYGVLETDELPKAFQILLNLPVNVHAHFLFREQGQGLGKK